MSKSPENKPRPFSGQIEERVKKELKRKRGESGKQFRQRLASLMENDMRQAHEEYEALQWAVNNARNRGLTVAGLLKLLRSILIRSGKGGDISFRENEQEEE